MSDLARLEADARKAGVIELTKLARGTVIFLECDNDLILEFTATDPALKTFTATANFGSLKRDQPVQILGAVAPGAERHIFPGVIIKDLRLALKIHGRLKILPMVVSGSLRGPDWYYDIWSD